MWIPGLSRSLIREELLENYSCQKCGEESTTSIKVFARSYTLLFIPFLPLGKVKTSFCNNCHTTYGSKGFSLVLKQLAVEVGRDTKTPLWHYGGIVSVVVAVLCGYFLVRYARNEHQEYFKSPQIGDVYYIQEEAGVYTTMRLAQVYDDSIKFQMNNYVVSSSMDIRHISRSTNYSSIYKTLSREEINILRNERAILQIKRPGK